MKLEFSFVTNLEKMIIMNSIPEREHVERIGKTILTRREFTDQEAKELFYSELQKLMYNRSLGVPKKLKKFR
tara:strand:+ start:6167 stop:6382 length:216 start_codon:yes stop_codon:yes gene_type:complete